MGGELREKKKPSGLIHPGGLGDHEPKTSLVCLFHIIPHLSLFWFTVIFYQLYKKRPKKHFKKTAGSHGFAAWLTIPGTEQ